MTLCNNPRGIRFLREETVLIFVFSGPHEPTQEQFNNISSVFVAKMQQLYNGKHFLLRWLQMQLMELNIKELNSVFMDKRNRSYRTHLSNPMCLIYLPVENAVVSTVTIRSTSCVRFVTCPFSDLLTLTVSTLQVRVAETNVDIIDINGVLSLQSSHIGVTGSI